MQSSHHRQHIAAMTLQRPLPPMIHGFIDDIDAEPAGTAFAQIARFEASGIDGRCVVAQTEAQPLATPFNA